MIPFAAACLLTPSAQPFGPARWPVTPMTAMTAIAVRVVTVTDVTAMTAIAVRVVTVTFVTAMTAIAVRVVAVTRLTPFVPIRFFYSCPFVANAFSHLSPPTSNFYLFSRPSCRLAFSRQGDPHATWC